MDAVPLVGVAEQKLPNPSVCRNGRSVARHRAAAAGGAGHVTATTAAGSWTMPVDGTSVRVLLDGPVVEISTTGGTMAVAIPSTAATREAHLTGGASAEIWSLR